LSIESTPAINQNQIDQTCRIPVNLIINQPSTSGVIIKQEPSSPLSTTTIQRIPQRSSPRLNGLERSNPDQTLSNQQQTNKVKRSLFKERSQPSFNSLENGDEADTAIEEHPAQRKESIQDSARSNGGDDGCDKGDRGGREEAIKNATQKLSSTQFVFEISKRENSSQNDGTMTSSCGLIKDMLIIPKPLEWVPSVEDEGIYTAILQSGEKSNITEGSLRMEARAYKKTKHTGLFGTSYRVIMGKVAIKIGKTRDDCYRSKSMNLQQGDYIRIPPQTYFCIRNNSDQDMAQLSFNIYT